MGYWIVCFVRIGWEDVIADSCVKHAKAVANIMEPTNCCQYLRFGLNGLFQGVCSEEEIGCPSTTKVVDDTVLIHGDLVHISDRLVVQCFKDLPSSADDKAVAIFMSMCKGSECVLKGRRRTS